MQVLATDHACQISQSFRFGQPIADVANAVLNNQLGAHYTRKTGRKVRRVNAVLQHPDPDKAWMLANLDYAVVACDEVQLLECKTAGEFGARLWKDGVPEYYQMWVSSLNPSVITDSSVPAADR